MATDSELIALFAEMNNKPVERVRVWWPSAPTHVKETVLDEYKRRAEKDAREYSDWCRRVMMS